MAYSPSLTDCRIVIQSVLTGDAGIAAWLAGGNDEGRVYQSDIGAAFANLPVGDMSVRVNVADVSPEGGEIEDRECQWYLCTFTVWAFSSGQGDKLASDLSEECERALKGARAVCMAVAGGRELELRQFRVVDRGGQQPAQGMWRMPVTITCLARYLS